MRGTPGEADQGPGLVAGGGRRASGGQTFYNDKLLVGGNGTAWTSANTGYKYCVIDTASTLGYLTAGERFN